MSYFREKVQQRLRDIKLGKKPANEKFAPLAEWITKKYGTKPLDILFKTDEGRLHCLEIVFDSEEEAHTFKNKKNNTDTKKTQQIADAYKELLKHKGSTNITFNSFERLTKIELVESLITKEDINTFKTKYVDTIWEVSRFFSYITIFFYTKVQQKEASENGIKKILEDELFQIVKQYDEFNYFQRADFSIMLDNKETFDSDYQSNWWYYYK